MSSLFDGMGWGEVAQLPANECGCDYCGEEVGYGE